MIPGPRIVYRLSLLGRAEGGDPLIGMHPSAFEGSDGSLGVPLPSGTDGRNSSGRLFESLKPDFFRVTRVSFWKNSRVVLGIFEAWSDFYSSGVVVSSNFLVEGIHPLPSHYVYCIYLGVVLCFGNLELLLSRILASMSTKDKLFDLANCFIPIHMKSHFGHTNCSASILCC